jgi:hypothetical protein
VAIDWPVREFGVRENWKCASLKTPRSPEDQRVEVMRHDDVTWDDMDTWDVCHVSVIFGHLEH